MAINDEVVLILARLRPDEFRVALAKADRGLTWTAAARAWR
jgi:hypothetical protein